MNLHTLVRHSSMNARVLNNLYFSRLKQNISSKKYCGASQRHMENQAVHQGTRNRIPLSKVEVKRNPVSLSGVPAT